jgi:nucleoside-diphosphate-sugar epimerase
MDRQSKALLFNEASPRYAFGFVHVEDCARVHVEALDQEKVGDGEVPRWYVAAGTVEEGVSGEQLWERAADMVEREYALEVEKGLFSVGRTKTPINMPFRAESRMTEKILLSGDTIRGMEECIREVAQWYSALKKKEALA